MFIPKSDRQQGYVNNTISDFYCNFFLHHIVGCRMIPAGRIVSVKGQPLSTNGMNIASVIFFRGPAHVRKQSSRFWFGSAGGIVRYWRKGGQCANEVPTVCLSLKENFCQDSELVCKLFGKLLLQLLSNFYSFFNAELEKVYMQPVSWLTNAIYKGNWKHSFFKVKVLVIGMWKGGPIYTTVASYERCNDTGISALNKPPHTSVPFK